MSRTLERRSMARRVADVQRQLLALESAEGTRLAALLDEVVADLSSDAIAREHQAIQELNAELEARVESRAAEMEQLLRQLPVGVLITDASGLLVKSVNDVAIALFGPDVTDAWLGERGLPLLDLDGRPVPPRELPGAVTVRNGEALSPARYLLDAQDGTRRVVEIATSPVTTARDVTTGVVMVVDDVTERERLARVEHEFVANASHQIRTPISAIVSAVAALEAGAKHEPVARDRFLAHVGRESDRLARLAEALLTLARATRGEGDPPAQIVALRPFLQALVLDAGVEISLDCPDDAAAVANLPLLEQALWNVVDNAIAHGKTGIAIRVAADAQWVMVEVSDTGPGIAADRIRAAFQRFARGRDDGAGFGLGLPIARSAAEACGGSISIRSVVGRGTTVTVSLVGASLKERI